MDLSQAYSWTLESQKCLVSTKVILAYPSAYPQPLEFSKKPWKLWHSPGVSLRLQRRQKLITCIPWREYWSVWPRLFCEQINGSASLWFLQWSITSDQGVGNPTGSCAYQLDPDEIVLRSYGKFLFKLVYPASTTVQTVG